MAVLLATSLLFSAPAAAAGSEDMDEKIQEAVSSIKEKDYKDAIERLKEVLDDSSDNADALNYLGYSYRKLGDYKQALDYYQQALDVDENHKGANEYIGEAYLELKKPAQAKLHLDRLAKICGPSCEEYLDLKAAYDAYLKAQKPS
jgi:tetratricopeptide (TPR) repeat protein